MPFVVPWNLGTVPPDIWTLPSPLGEESFRLGPDPTPPVPELTPLEEMTYVILVTFTMDFLWPQVRELLSVS